MGGKSPPPQTTSTTKNELSPEQKKLFDLAMPFAEEHAKKPLETYQGPTVAGFTPDQLAAQQKYRDSIGGGQELGDQSAASQKFMLSLDQLDPNSNPYISGIADQITGKIQTGLVEKTLPVIRGGATTAGGMYGGGSTRGQLAEGRAVGDAASAAGDALETLYSNNYRAGIDNIARAQGLNSKVQFDQLFGANVLDAVGGQTQAMEQALLNEKGQKWSMEQYAPYMRAQEIAALLGFMPNNGSTTTTSTGALPGRSVSSGVLGGAASGAAAGSAFGPWGTGIGAVVGGLGGYFG